MNPESLIPACVLHRRDYRNTSLLLELFTPSEGRLPAIVRGAKSGRGNRVGLLQPFSPLLVSLRGRGEIQQLLQAEPEGRAYGLHGERLYCGFYLNELLMRLLERRDPYPRLYVHYLDALDRLAAGEAADRCLREFELTLLQELGYGLLLDHTADSGEPVQAGQRYHYAIEQGPVTATIASSAPLIHGRTLLSLHNREPLDPASAREAKRLLRRVLAFYLGDKPLKSRELFQGLKPS